TMYDAVGGFKLGGGGTTNMCRDILAEYRGNRIFSKVVNAIKQTKDSKMVVIACADGSSYNGLFALSHLTAWATSSLSHH
ncbi:hypothetical protein QWJ41_21015, partial [Nocardioides sp. SOB44]